VDLRDVTAGPFETARFRLESTGGGTDGAKRYAIEIDARASPRDLAAVAGEQFGDLGRLLGEIAGGAIPFGAASVPLRLDGQLESRDGEVEMVAGTAAVAGVPAGPLARIVTDAILSRL
jgi:hypothetical protein